MVANEKLNLPHNGNSGLSEDKPVVIPIRDEFIAGAFAGFLARLITAPFDFAKIRIQLLPQANQHTSVFGIFRKVVQEEGFLALWKGNLSATYLWISYAMVQFSVYASLKRFGDRLAADYQRDHMSKSSTGQRAKPIWLSKTMLLFFAGAGAGIAATVATYPFDIMRTQFVIQGSNRVFPSMSSFVTHTYQSRGIQG
jgi:solute carrier family 25 (mitochondrial thiamine pyrophosphate transporter), member 19